MAASKAARTEKVNEEVAKQAFNDFLDDMDIDLDTNASDDNEKQTTRRLIKAIRFGDLTFNDDGEAVYTPWRKGSSYKEALTFHERDASTLTAGDNKGRDNDAKKLYAMMGQLCKVPPKTFQQLVGTDIKNCEAIAALLIV